MCLPAVHVQNYCGGPGLPGRLSREQTDSMVLQVVRLLHYAVTLKHAEASTYVTAEGQLSIPPWRTGQSGRLASQEASSFCTTGWKCTQQLTRMYTSITVQTQPIL